MLIKLYINLNSFFHFGRMLIIILWASTEVELLVDRNKTDLTFQPIDWSHDGDRPILSLVVYVLNDKSTLLGDVVVRAYVLVYLVHRALSLGDVCAALLQDLLMRVVDSFL